MSNHSDRQAATWHGRTRPDAPARDESTITVRGFDAPQSSREGTATTSGARTSSNRYDAAPEEEQYAHLRPRRVSLAERFESLGTAGGVNSLSNFAASWQRAAGFYQIAHRPSESDLRNVDDSDEAVFDAEQDPENGDSRGSLLRAALEHDRRRVSEQAVFDDSEAASPATLTDVETRIQQHRRSSLRRSSMRRASIRDGTFFNDEPPPLASGYPSSYGSLTSRINEPARREAGRLYSQQQSSGTEPPDKEREPLITKRVQSPHGTTISVIVGQSTVPQTIFNSVNVLIGVGMLSLPLAIRYSGWLIGMLFFLFSAISTAYTAKLLAKCIDVDQTLVTFADIAYVSFGHRARVVVSILFSLELLAACVALVILFADSVDLLIPGWDVTAWKVVCGLVIIPLSFMPMRLLSYTSILGILSCVLIVVTVFVDGLVKPHPIGSLREPAKTYLFPADWRTLPLAFGLLMAPWGGHSVFPNIYRDMRHPYKYNKAVDVTYIFTYLVEVALAIAGYIMFGEEVRDEITANIFLTKGYPKVLSIIIMLAIAIIPLTKIPLNSRPIVSTIEIFMGLDARAMPGSSYFGGMSSVSRGILKVTIRIVVPILLVILAILVPSFDRVMSLLGSMACFSICIILPCSFHLKLFGKEMPLRQKFLDWTLVVICSILAIIGTVCAFIPQNLLGAD